MSKFKLFCSMAVLCFLLSGCQSRPHALDPVIFTQQEAIAKVLPEHPEFPAEPGERPIETHVGAPGNVERGSIKTESKRLDAETYQVIFTKKWNVLVNGVDPIRRYEYRVSPTKIQLVSSVDHADVIDTIK